MAPAPRPGWSPGKVPEGARRAAALIAIFDGAAGEVESASLVLTVRAASLPSHAGQVSLPGGARQPAESAAAAAFREAHEEIDLDPHGVTLAGALTPLYVPVSNFLIEPVVGVTPGRPAFRANAEVAEILELPLASLIDPGIRGRRPHARGGRVVDVPHYVVAGHEVWGATAMILAELAALLDETTPPAQST